MTTLSVQDKKILLIMPCFYHYELDIQKALRKAGAEVYFIDSNIHAHSLWEKLLCFYTTGLRDRMVYRYYAEKLKEMDAKKHAEIDEVLVIRGQWITEDVMTLLRRHCPKACFRMYQWDSVSTFPYQKVLAPFFDRVMTFDPVDSATYHWALRPLFFKAAECDIRPERERKYDLIFLCSMHTRRMQILLQLRKIADRLEKKVFSYIYVPRLQYIREALLKQNPLYRGAREALHFQSLPEEKTREIYNQARVFVDYTFPQQNGLSMRTIESVGHRCKLVTNNRHVRDTDFYDPANVFLYEGEKLEIPADFLESPYHVLPEETYQRYSLEGFLAELFSEA